VQLGLDASRISTVSYGNERRGPWAMIPNRGARTGAMTSFPPPRPSAGPTPADPLYLRASTTEGSRRR